MCFLVCVCVWGGGGGGGRAWPGADACGSFWLVLLFACLAPWTFSLIVFMLVFEGHHY